MSQLFKDQSLLTITCETGYDSLDDATTTKIKYRKPSGETGEWIATVSGSDLVYNLTNGDIDEIGTWQFQAYFVVGGLKSFGSIKSKLFQNHL
jgi:hypothetical protein